MRVLMHECKKILNPRLLMIIMLFTLLFYNLFISATGYPDYSASAEAELRLSQKLLKETGTTLPNSELDLLNRIQDEEIEKLDQMVSESEVFRNEGVTTFAEMKKLDHDALRKDGKEEVLNEIDKITFDTGEKEVFLVQAIDSDLEHIERTNCIGATEEEVERYLREFYPENEALKYRKGFSERIKELHTRTEMGIIEESMVDLIFGDFPRLGILMMLSCILLILPYQVREKLSKVRGLQSSTLCGRKIWKKQLAATIFVSLFVCVVQAGIYFLLLWKVGILDFAACPLTTGQVFNTWYDMSWGVYLMLYTMLIIGFAVAVMAVFYLIARAASNYVIGFALVLVPAVLFGMLCSRGFVGFLYMSEYQNTVEMPIGIVAGGMMAALIMNIVVSRWDRRRDIFE